MIRTWLKFVGVSVVSLPLLPLLVRDGRKIRESLPVLPEAAEPEGQFDGPRPLQLLCLGESTMAGVGVTTHREGIAGAFAEEIAALLGRGVEYRVLARNGYTLKMVRRRCLPKLSRAQENGFTPELILVGIGGNDAFTLNRPWQFRKELRGLIAGIRERCPEARILFCNMPPIKDFPAFTRLIKFTVGNWVEMLGAVLADEVPKHPGVYFNAETLRLSSWLPKLPEEIASRNVDAFFSDGMHPSQMTYQIWGQEMARFAHVQVPEWGTNATEDAPSENPERRG